MKLQNFTVIFIIIIIPVILLVSLYISTGLKTLKYQSLYDNGLLTATHDAIYAFEQNTANDESSGNPEEKRDILKSSVKMFEKSLCNSCGISLYSTDEIEENIPAIVFGMYDGFYMYAPSYNSQIGKYEHELKSYVYYSETFEDGTIIRYALDNYVVVSGDFGKGYEVKAGYLIDLTNSNANGTKYKGIEIQTEKIDRITNKEAINYYKDAYEFTDWFLNIAKIQEKKNSEGVENTYLDISDTNDPENENSAFVKHKNKIIKEKMQGVLNSSITAYSERTLGYNYKMPKLSEVDWEKVYSNISMITFFQGRNIGLTTYNGYCVLNSTNNREYVNSNLMYFIDGNGYYHDIRCEKCEKDGVTLTGYKIGDFGKKKVEIEVEQKDSEGNIIQDENGNPKTEKIEKYQYEHDELACYSCINGQLSTAETVYNYINTKDGSEKKTEIKQWYWTSLARERYNTTKLLNNDKITIPKPDAEFIETDYSYNYDGINYKTLAKKPSEGGITALGKKQMIINSTFSVDSIPDDNEATIVSSIEGAGWSLIIKNQKINFIIWNSAINNYSQIELGDTTISTGQIYNITAIYDGDYLRLYLNGGEEMKKVQIGESDLTQQNHIPTIIGGNPSGEWEIDGNTYFYGKIYNTKLWYNKIFNEKQINFIAEEGIKQAEKLREGH